MRLTNYIRDGFVRAVMQDVPKVDYTEEIRKKIVEIYVSYLPAKIQAAYKDPDLRPYIHTSYTYIGNQSYSYPLGQKVDVVLTEAHKAELARLKSLEDNQSKARKELSSRLRAVAYSVTTRKALGEMLPEFEKYMPVDEAAALRTVPVVANVVADFVKAGWPAGKPAPKPAPKPVQAPAPAPALFLASPAKPSTPTELRAACGLDKPVAKKAPAKKAPAKKVATKTAPTVAGTKPKINGSK